MLEDSARPLHSVVSVLVSVGALVTLVVACGPGNVASNLVKPPEFAPKDQAKCGVTKSQAKPLIVEWPSSERSELEARAKRGLVAVRYEGCEMEMLPRCRVPGSYKYVAITPKSDELVIRDADDLYASVPLGAAKLESRLSRAASLRVAMTIVGRYEADADEVRPDQLTGECARATHFVSALTAGAFDFYAEGKAQVRGKATGLGAGVGGDSSAERENITKDGDPSACGGARSEDAKPPSSCGALLRIEVVPFGAARRVEAQCPDGSKWSGSACVRTSVVEAPAPAKPFHSEAAMNYYGGGRGWDTSLVPNEELYLPGKAEISPKGAHYFIEALTRIRSASPTARLEIQVSSDNLGDPEKNFKLCEARAEQGRKWFIDHGVDGKRITTRPMGDTKPVADPKTKEGQAKNRRTEVLLQDGFE